MSKNSIHFPNSYLHSIGIQQYQLKNTQFDSSETIDITSSISQSLIADLVLACKALRSKEFDNTVESQSVSVKVLTGLTEIQHKQDEFLIPADLIADNKAKRQLWKVLLSNAE